MILYRLMFKEKQTSFIIRAYNKFLRWIGGIVYPIKYKLFKKKYKLDENSDVIVSLTSFPPRIGKVALTIESIFRQKVLPSRIILWLAVEEFPNKDEDLPANLLNLKQYGLEIMYCTNLKPYKKFYHTGLNYPNNRIVTVDDDVIYDDKMLGKLIETSNKNPDCVICNRTRTILADDLDYNNWKLFDLKKEEKRMLLLPIGIGGVLYPSGYFKNLSKHSIDTIMELAPTTDDIFLRFYGLKEGYPAVSRGNYKGAIIVGGSQKSGLFHINNGNQQKNNDAIQKLYKYFELDFKNI